MERKVHPLQSHVLMQELLAKHYAEAKKAKAEGQKIVWCCGQAATDILLAMDILPMYPENHAALCGARGVSTDLCQIAEGHDYNPDLCSYARNELGWAFSGDVSLSPLGGLPEPDILLIATLCNTHLKWFENLSRIYNVPLLTLDTPLIHDGMGAEEVETIVGYVHRQLEEEIAFLEDFTGRRYNYDRLQEVVANTSRAAQLYGEVVSSARNIPSPITAFDTFLHLGALMDLRGFPQAVTYYQTLRDEVMGRVDSGFAAVGEERYRLYWDGIPIWFRVGHLGRKFASYGACCAVALYPFVWVEAFAREDPEDPLGSIARAQSTIYVNRGTQYVIDFLCQVVEDYSLDGLVMQMSRTCKPVISAQLAVMKAVEKRAGVPAVLIEGDMVDARLYSDADVDNRIETFMAVLEGRAKAGA